MGPSHGYLLTRTPLLLAAAIFFICIGTTHVAVAASSGHATPDIEMVLQDPRVVRRITAWGMSMQDIRHDVSTMLPAQRVQLAFVLSRRWRTTNSHSQAALQTQFLVMLSLMRESTLYASVLSTRNLRMLQ